MKLGDPFALFRAFLLLRHGRHVVLEKIGDVGGAVDVLGDGRAGPLGFEGIHYGLPKPNAAGGVVFAEPDCQSREHLIDVLVRVPNHQKRQHRFIEHRPRNKKGQVGQHVLALALLGGVVQLEIKGSLGKRDLVVQREVMQQDAVQCLDSDVGSVLDVSQEGVAVALVTMHQGPHEMGRNFPVAVVVCVCVHVWASVD